VPIRRPAAIRAPQVRRLGEAGAPGQQARARHRLPAQKAHVRTLKVSSGKAFRAIVQSIDLPLSPSVSLPICMYVVKQLDSVESTK
jgi:hypothetical protein